MAGKKASESKIEVGNIHDISGEVNVAGRDIYKGFTAEQVSALIKQFTLTFEPKKYYGRSPYKGLDVFEEDDADLFFGREKIVNDLVSRVKESRTMFTTGPSGSGKSSLIRAGLIPSLKNGAVKNSEFWEYATIKPGRDPFEALKSAFSRLTKSPELGNYFIQHLDKPDVLNECTESILTERKSQRLVLFIDQFEEVFTQINREEERVRFLSLITNATAIENGRLIILFSMRSDFVSNCATYPELNTLLNQQFVQIGAMQPNELVSAIVQPALRVGLRIDPNLIAQMINDMQGEPGALPLMQFALKDLFDARQTQGGIIALTLTDYFERGGIHKALERHANDSFNKLDQREQELTRSIFSGLIEIGRGTEDTKRTANFDELVPANTKPEEIKHILQKLQDARLITTENHSNRYTIIHEKLINAWPWLTKLMNENRDAIALQNEIADDTEEWNNHDRDTSYLYRGLRLADVREKFNNKKIILPETSRIFVQAGIDEYTNELEFAKRRTLSLRRQTRNLAIAFVVAVIAAGIAVFFGFRSQQQLKIGLARQLAIQAQSISSTGDSKQQIAILLALHSMELHPNVTASHVLQNNLLALPIVNLEHDTSFLRSMTISTNGKFIVTSGGDNVEVWDLSTGKEITRMHHFNTVNSVVISSDGKYVVSGSEDKTTRMWDINTGKEVLEIVNNSWVESVALSPDNKHLFIGGCVEKSTLPNDCARGSGSLWDVSSGKQIFQLADTNLIKSVIFSPNGSFFVTTSAIPGSLYFINGKNASVWNSFNGEKIFSISDFAGINVVAISPTNTYIVVGHTNGLIEVLSSFSGDVISKMHHDANVNSITFSVDGKLMISGSSDHSARLWDVVTGREILRLEHNDNVNSAVFTPDKKFILTGSDDQTARLWDAFTGVELARITHNSVVNFVMFSPDGKLKVSGDAGGTVYVWKSNLTEEISPFHLVDENQIVDFSFGLHGKYKILSMNDDTTQIWDTSSNQKVATLNQGIYLGNVVFSPDGKYLAAQEAEYSEKISIWDLVTGRQIMEIVQDEIVISILFVPTLRQLAISSSDNIGLWDFTTGKMIWEMPYHSYHDATSSPNGKYIAAGGYLLNALTGQVIMKVDFDDTVYSAFSPDGRYLVSGGGNIISELDTLLRRRSIYIKSKAYSSVDGVTYSPDGRYLGAIFSETVQIYDMDRVGQEISHFIHDTKVSYIMFSPDSKYVVSIGKDNIIHVWEVTTGNEVAQIAKSNFSLFPVSFTANGKQLILADKTGNTYLWQWRPDDLISEACSRVTRDLTLDEWTKYTGNVLPYQVICH